MKTIKIMGKQFLSAEKNYIVPGDPSSAAFIIVLGALTKNSSVTLHNILLNEKRIGFLKVLKKMGANIQIKNKK
jgi:5-enolpyruvylshikimate-3-phosphate synthase